MKKYFSGMWNEIKCMFGKHEIYVHRYLSTGNRQLRCMHCKKLWLMNDDSMSVIPWDLKFETVEREISEIFAKLDKRNKSTGEEIIIDRIEQ